MPESKDHKARTITFSIPKEDTHPGPGLRELNGKTMEGVIQ